MAPPLSRRKRFAFTLASVLFGLAVALAVAETALYVVERKAVPPPAQTDLALLRPNPHGSGSYRLMPNLRVQTTVKGQAVRIATNSHGMRWREVPLAAPPGRRRIALLGDSFAFGCWSSSIEKSFAGVTDALLATHGQELLNFGVGGYGVDDMELLLREQVAAFEPAAVVVTVFSGNDYRDTFLGLHKQRLVEGKAILDRANLAARLAPRFLYRDDVRPLPAPDPNWLRAQASRLRTGRLLYRALDAENPWLLFQPGRGFLSFTFWSRRPAPAVASEAIEQTLQVLSRIRAWTDAHGARLYLVAIPFREQVYAATAAGRDYDVARPQARLEEYAVQQGIAYLDLLPVLRARATATGEQMYLAGDIHFNDRGHELAGLAMARLLMANP